MLTVYARLKVFLQVGFLTCAFISPVVALDFTIDGMSNAGSLSEFNNRAVRTDLLPIGDYKISITSGAISLCSEGCNITAISFRAGETGRIFDLGVLDIPPDLQHLERYYDGVNRSPQEAFDAYLPSGNAFQNVTLEAPAALLFYLIDNLQGDAPFDNSGSLVVRVEPRAQTCVPSPEGLVSWWPGEGNTTDIVGDNSGALQGTATFTPGMVSQGFSFGETDTDAVIIGNSPDLQLQTFTIEGWVKRGSTDIAGRDPNNQGGLIFGYGTGGYGLGMSVEGQLFLSQIDFSEVRSEGLQVTDTNFHHIAVTKSGATVRFYVDGIEDLAPDYDPEFFFDTDVAIGNRGDLFLPSFIPDTFIGIIDEVSIYNRALTAEEIAVISTAGSAGKCNTLQPCTLNLEASFPDGTLSLAFTLGTPEPATWNVWLTAQNEIVRLLSLPLAVLDPPVPVPFTIPFVPPLGTVGILTTLTTPDQGILCSEFATVDTGPVSEDAATAAHELQDVLQHLVQ